MKLKLIISMAVVALVAASPAFALNSLQLGPGAGGGWYYDTGDDTWKTNTNPFSLFAYANATAADGGNGAYAWDALGAANQTAYFVVSAVPMINFDGFDVAIAGASFVTSGYGAPPLSDPNSLAPHGIFDSWFEIYEFQFDGGLGTISDTQPGQTGTGQGYSEELTITINSLATGVTGVHMDLFVMEGDGDLLTNVNVNSFAPYSHDAQGNPIPEPGSLMLLGMGLAGMGVVYRRRRKN